MLLNKMTSLFTNKKQKLYHVNIPYIALFIIVCGFVLIACDALAENETPSSSTPNADLTLADCKNSNKYSCISIMDSGQGNCVVISCKGGDKIINDCGGDPTKAKSIEKYFKAIGVHDKGLKAVVVSHPHADHYDLLPKVLKRADMTFDDKNRYFVDVAAKADYTKGNFDKWYEEMIEASDAPLGYEHLNASHHDTEGTPHTQLGCTTGNAGEGLYVLAANVGLTIPPEEYNDKPNSACSDEGEDGPLNSPMNDRSIVLKFHRANFGMTLPGDAGKKVEKKILERYSTGNFLNMNAHLLSHHGSCNNVNSKNWVKKINSEVVVTSAALNTTYSHPRCLSTSLYENNETLLTAVSHKVGCYMGRDRYTDPIPDSTKASYNTLQSSMIVFRINEDNGKYEVYTCPNNKIENCEKGVSEQ